MARFKGLFVGAVALAFSAGAAVAQTTVKWLHIEANPVVVKIWDEVAREFEAKNPGVKVEMQYLENEAYKAKAPTLLQSRDRPHIIFSWAGGVLKSQVEAGVLEDITAAMQGYKDNLSASAVDAFTVDGKIYGVPYGVSQVGFMANKDLLAKAGIDAGKIATYDDLLDAVKKLKAAGVTPLAVGGADKWPVHFYWTNLAVRLGGKAAMQAALKGQDGGFEGETFQKSGELFKQLVDLQPFQNGFLGFKSQQAIGHFGDGKAAMLLAISSFYHTQKVFAVDKTGVPDDKLAWINFPTVPGGKGLPSDTLGGINGWLVTKGAPKEAVAFLKYFVSAEPQKRLAAGNFVVPVYKGAEAGLGSAFMRNIAQNIANSSYHQNFYDQDLGPSVGRVVNDATTEIAAGTMTPKQAAKAIQDAFRQGN
ncbi:Raffinose/stachyose/melibiose transport system substrate-binding protein [Bosea sp. 62]|uniref:ABC transporter substrate-binding protein n=1 Tax=unclassified Bosea (in: a-proteobacteria) TaxID=2653178 RepID=UPI0012597A9F|nr:MULTISPECIES: extracellular solute-binding protein [unclassified Bosea (in: a-proteobacteria)]CAD5251493.1 Raffinose/stachyose/melibiose transport system substrate-binding protein [Bosea sp. 7B]CAD5280482.1 Raffinose/stachyose/melibiose transport system substrate-binding protein [Bosea sp. 21B]CAD5281589.1 Raffinose/stachyose/melibiose transport system substrate-binding protein [Bosea sp. 46]VVT59426.1 Raffinose/stachyose/melibiose transport system substrate-binding protein [Bosea sp. EC-HK3